MHPVETKANIVIQNYSSDLRDSSGHISLAISLTVCHFHLVFLHIHVSFYFPHPLLFNLCLSFLQPDFIYLSIYVM
jgi:hypothetical protein